MSLHRPPLILLVDDDNATTAILQGILHNAGLHTCIASSATDALSVIRKKRPDLILLDVGLPDASGIDLCRKVHQEPFGSQIPVLFLSSNEDISTKVRGFEAGGVDYITKPFSGVEVLARVNTHLRLRNAYEQLAELQAERVWKLAVAQEAIMPTRSDLPEAKFHIILRQAHAAGGDFYDVIRSGDQITDYIIADASGHDLSTSYWTAALKALLSTSGDSVNSPRDILGWINNALRRIVPEGIFFTMLYARLNRHTGRLLLANAGHPPAILLRGNAPGVEIVHQEGDVVGPFADAIFGFKEVTVSAGDRFLLYTDGLIEIGSDFQAETARLAGEFAGRREAPLEEQLHRVIDAMVAGREKKDDILLMGVEV